MASNLIQKKATSTAIAQKKPTLKDYIQQYVPEIEKALPSCGITAARFARLMTSALSSNPELAKCTPQSFLGAMMSSAQLGLEPNSALGMAYIIPYNSKEGKVAQFQLGYKGLLTLVYRSGEISSVTAEVVYSNDEFEYELGLNPKLNHHPRMDGDRGVPVAYYAVWHGKDGGYGFSVMSKADVEQHRKQFSKAMNSPWVSNFDSMALKTVLKRALKYAPISTDIMRDVNADETVKTNFRMEDISSGDTNIMDVPADVVEAEGTVSDDEVPFADKSGLNAAGEDVPDFLK